MRGHARQRANSSRQSGLSPRCGFPCSSLSCVGCVVEGLLSGWGLPQGAALLLCFLGLSAEEGLGTDVCWQQVEQREVVTVMTAPLPSAHGVSELG